MSDFADGESWGYRKFYELAKLVSNDAISSLANLSSISLSLSLPCRLGLQESDGFLRDDTLVLRFSVRALTTHQKCRDLSTHVRRLEHKVENLQKVRAFSFSDTTPFSSVFISPLSLSLSLCVIYICLF